MRVDHGPPLFPDRCCLIFRMVLREEFQDGEVRPGPTSSRQLCGIPGLRERREKKIFAWTSIKTVPSPE